MPRGMWKEAAKPDGSYTWEWHSLRLVLPLKVSTGHPAVQQKRVRCERDLYEQHSNGVTCYRVYLDMEEIGTTRIRWVEGKNRWFSTGWANALDGGALWDGPFTRRYSAIKVLLDRHIRRCNSVQHEDLKRTAEEADMP